MCHSSENNRKTNRLHERCLRTIYNDKQSSFNELLENDGSISIDERNLQVLATEILKISNGLSTPLIKDIFPINKNWRQNSQFSRPWINVVYHGIESISNLKYNVKLRHLSGRCQITSVWCLYCCLQTELTNYSFDL